jgi:hypothetical protein
MALTADVEAIDLVVEPHSITPRTLAAFRSAVLERRRGGVSSGLTAEARALISRRRAAIAGKPPATPLRRKAP